ncbi:PEP-CTERM sorting domain-containing protein [Haloferula sp.]|uniref:PEP-CTERM sorting domain-containing protein n=1 Tax=Haloferula sp. TaxID=2497595 RepID=UPI00329E6E25
MSLAVLALGTTLSANAAVSIVGVSNATQSTYSGDASALDLINQGQSTFSSVAYSEEPRFGGATRGNAANNGAHGADGANTEITFWLSAVANETYTITYDLNTAVNAAGYDINSIQSIHAWTNNSGNQKNHNYTVEVSTVSGGAAFSNIATVAYLPFSDAGQSGASKVNITEDDTGILATGVDQIRFTYTIPDPSGVQASPTIREIDVFGVATIPEPSSTALFGLGALGLALRRRRSK